jgi:hypothetical protein
LVGGAAVGCKVAVAVAVARAIRGEALLVAIVTERRAVTVAVLPTLSVWVGAGTAAPVERAEIVAATAAAICVETAAELSPEDEALGLESGITAHPESSKDTAPASKSHFTWRYTVVVLRAVWCLALRQESRKAADVACP